MTGVKENGAETMKKNERLRYILSMLSANSDISIAQISRELSVSQVTIRKDMTELENQGLLVRTHGHAKLLQPTLASSNSCFIMPEAHDDYQKKQIIGELASSLVEDDDFIFIGPGYTCLELARKIINKNRLSILTINVSAAIELSAPESSLNSETKLQVAPGNFTRRNGTYYVTGLNTINFFKDVYFDKVFITVDGISERGFTVLDEETAQIYCAMIKPCTKVYICATNAKFGKNARAYLGDLGMATAVVSEMAIPELYVSLFSDLGVQIIVPDSQD